MPKISVTHVAPGMVVEFVTPRKAKSLWVRVEAVHRWGRQVVIIGTYRDRVKEKTQSRTFLIEDKINRSGD